MEESITLLDEALASHRCQYSSAATTSKPKAAPKAMMELWGVDDKGNEVPLAECDIALVTYEALMKELRTICR